MIERWVEHAKLSTLQPAINIVIKICCLVLQLNLKAFVLRLVISAQITLLCCMLRPGRSMFYKKNPMNAETAILIFGDEKSLPKVITLRIIKK